MLKSLIDKNKHIAKISSKIKNKKPKKENIVEDWYLDRYQTIVIQRNFLILIVIISIIGMIISVLTVLHINSSQTLEPFVVEIEKKTGITTLVKQEKFSQYTENEAINNYFLVKYVRARELFNQQDYTHNWYTVVRLLSGPTIYRDFQYFIHLGNKSSPANIFANSTSTQINIKSIQYLTKTSVQIRFTIKAKFEGETKHFNKIALISFEYIFIRLNEDQRYINPLGFQVTSYRVTNEVL